MISKARKSYYLNSLLLLLGIVCILAKIVLAVKPQPFMLFFRASSVKTLHEWTSYILTILVTTHLLLHLSRLKVTAKK
jgi:hypothetical protein